MFAQGWIIIDKCHKFITYIFGSFSCQYNLKFKTVMNFYDAIFPLHFVSKLSGFTLFSINSKTFATRFSCIDAILIIVTSVVNFGLNHFFWNHLVITSYFKSQIIRTILPTLMYGKFFINFLTFVWSIAMRKKIARLLKAIQDVDEMVSYFKYM